MNFSEILLRGYRHIRNKCLVYNTWALDFWDSKSESILYNSEVRLSFSGDRSTYYELSKDDRQFLLCGRIKLLGTVRNEPIDWNCVDDRYTFPKVLSNKIKRHDAQNHCEIRELGHLHRLQFVCDVSRFYYYSGDYVYKQKMQHIIDDWYINNPFGIGYAWCDIHQIAVRMVSILLAYLIIASKEKCALKDVIPLKIKILIERHAWVIRRNLSLFSSANNHLLGELAALALYDLLTTKNISSFQKFQHEFNRQHHDDGGNKEESHNYGRYVLQQGLILASLYKKYSPGAVQKDFSDTLFKTYTFFSDCIDDVSNAHINFGDSDDTLFFQFNCRQSDLSGTVLAFGDLFFHASFLKDYKHSEREFALWFKSILTSGLGFPVSSHIVRHYNNSKLLVIKHQNSNSFHVIFDYGELGLGQLAAHGHCDCLSVYLTINGYPIIIDSGNPSYQNSKTRNYFRSTAAHSTVKIAGKDQAEMAGPFLWRARHSSEMLSCCENDKRLMLQAKLTYADKSISHIRSLSYTISNFKLCITDQLEGGEGVATWILSPMIVAKILSDNAIRLILPDNTVLHYHCTEKCTIEDAEISPQFGVVKKSKKIVIAMTNPQAQHCFSISK